LRKRARRTSRGEADQTFLFSKILEGHGRRRHHLNGGGIAGGDRSEPAPTSTPCRMKWYVDRKHFSIVIPSF